MRHNPRWDITLLLPERLTRASARTTKNVAAKRQIRSLCRRGCRGEKFGRVAAMPSPGCRNTIACPRVQRRPEGPPGMAGSSAYQAPCHLVSGGSLSSENTGCRQGSFPRADNSCSKEELELGVWLHKRRRKLHLGELDAAKSEALDKALPGWPVAGGYG